MNAPVSIASSLWLLATLVTIVLGLAAKMYNYTRENARLHVDITAAIAVLTERSSHQAEELDRIARNVHDIRKELLHMSAQRSIDRNRGN